MDWRRLVSDSLVRPRVAARAVLGLGMPTPVLVECAAAVAAIGVLLSLVAVELAAGNSEQVAAILENPLLGALFQFGSVLLGGFLVARIGRLFGGAGLFAGALALVVWLNAMMILIQIAQLALLALVPPLADLLTVAAIVWGLWALANFVAELHGFENPVFVLGGVILSVLVLFFGLAILLMILGIGPQEPV